MRSFWSILPVILIGLCGCKSDIDQFGEYVVTLKNEPYPLTFPAYGISNIFFDSILNYQFVFPDKCEHMQVAALTNLEGKRPVYIARMMIDDSTIYSVDVNNDFNFRNDTFLVFDKRIGAVPVASVSLNIPRQDLTLQILLDLPWIYARVANYKTGFIHLMDQTYRVELHSRSRLTPYHEIMIDFDQNDSIFKQSVVSGDEVFISEMVDPRYPFYLAGKRLLLDKKSDFELTFKETEDEQSPNIAGLAPSINVVNVLDSSDIYTLPVKNKLELIEFWSVYCPFSDDAHQELRGFLTLYKSLINYNVICRENEVKDILDKF